MDEVPLPVHARERLCRQTPGRVPGRHHGKGHLLVRGEAPGAGVPLEPLIRPDASPSCPSSRTISLSVKSVYPYRPNAPPGGNRQDEPVGESEVLNARESAGG